MLRRCRTTSVAFVALMMLSAASCTRAPGSTPDAGSSRGPDHLPDIASEMSNHDILTNHVAANGGPPMVFGPYQGPDLAMFAACLGGGAMTLTAVPKDKPHLGAKLSQSCGEPGLPGTEFSRYIEDLPICIIATFEGTVTAWEVVVIRLRDNSSPVTPMPTPKSHTCSRSSPTPAVLTLQHRPT